MICEKCGCDKNAEDAMFCYNCGAKLNGSAPSEQLSEPQSAQTQQPILPQQPQPQPQQLPQFYRSTPSAQSYYGAPQGYYAPMYAQPRKAKKMSKGLVAVLVLVSLAMMTLFCYAAYNFYKGFKQQVIPLAEYTIACSNANAVYSELSDEMQLERYGTEYGFIDPSNSQIELYKEVLEGGTYRCDTDGKGVQGVVYRAIRDNGYKDAEKGIVYVGFDRTVSKLFVQWKSDKSDSVVGQAPNMTSSDKMPEITFGEFYAGDSYRSYNNIPYDNDPDSPRERISGGNRKRSKQEEYNV